MGVKIKKILIVHKVIVKRIKIIIHRYHRQIKIAKAKKQKDVIAKLKKKITQMKKEVKPHAKKAAKLTKKIEKHSLEIKIATQPALSKKIFKKKLKAIKRHFKRFKKLERKTKKTIRFAKK